MKKRLQLKLPSMHARILFILLLLANLITANAQVVPPEIRQVLPEKGIYRFPAFTEGSIVFRNGIISSGRLNYNVSTDEMHFISEKGDTLALAEPASISFISFNNSRFYYDKSYLQTIDTITTNGMILAFKQTFSMQQRRKAGAYDMAPAHEGVKSVNFYGDNGKPYALEDDARITVTARELYFFGDMYGHFTKTGKEFIYDHFRKHQEAIKDFLSANHINFNNYKDLLKLMEFCRGLPA